MAKTWNLRQHMKVVDSPSYEIMGQLQTEGPGKW